MVEVQITPVRQVGKSHQPRVPEQVGFELRPLGLAIRFKLRPVRPTVRLNLRPVRPTVRLKLRPVRPAIRVCFFAVIGRYP
ncbi:hypothetical protein [Mycolicibacter algericus]|uniref:hypothetical protein n=1 Tax=Mycolicibacter algericus TaxID=1288388 RepID=UPI003C78C476